MSQDAFEQRIRNANPADVQRFLQASGTEVPTTPGAYVPPKGFPILNVPKAAKVYRVDDPTPQTDLLIRYERRHIIPPAQMIAPIFGALPMPDDIYRSAPDHHKNNLYCVISRSGIQKHGSVLNWDAIVVLVQQICIVRINCDLNPGTDEFAIRRMLLWVKDKEDYIEVKDPDAPSISPLAIISVLQQFAAAENVQ